MDEGDQWVYNSPQTTLDFLKDKTSIILTATVDGGDKSALEHLVLKYFKFQIYNHYHERMKLASI
jgi:hypothetical protein